MQTVEVLNLEECLEDGPLFRKSIRKAEISAHSFEHSLKLLHKALKNSIEAGNGN